MKYLKIVPIIIALVSCSKDEEVVNLPPVSIFSYEDAINKIILNGKSSTDPDNDKLSFTWTCSSSNLLIKNSNLSMAELDFSSQTKEEVVTITLKVSDGKLENSFTQSLRVPAFTEVRSFGLGKNLIKEVTNTAPYEWYIDQANTGQYSLVNCGPASVTMAIKWANESFNKTPEDARNIYHSSGGWWYTSDVINYLYNNGASTKTIPLTDINYLKEEVEHGNIIILCLDMFQVELDKEAEKRIDKFYLTENSGWGHFMVVKGYKEVDDKTFFEAYDPYSWNETYADRTLKGRNRYYNSTELDKATQAWWDNAIVISRSASPGGRLGVNTANIKHMPGR